MREMGQSAWLNTSSFTLQASEGRVNVREIGKESNDWILWGNIYSVWPVSERKVETFRKNRPRCETTVDDRDTCTSCKMLKKAVQQGRSE